MKGGSGFAPPRPLSRAVETPSQAPWGPAPSRTAPIVPFLLAFVACVQGPGHGQGGVAERWREAQALWERGDVGAWDAWRSLPADTPEGREAHRRLQEADVHYREGVRRLREGRRDAREELRRGLEIAPMDPRLYLPLARGCRERGLIDRAKEYYLKFLAGVPDAPEAGDARREVRELDAELGWVFDLQAVPEREEGGVISAPIAAGAAVALLGAIALGVHVLRRRGTSLERLAEDSPELHPAVAYLVGSLRHELLKHRIGAVGDALRALDRGDASDEHLAFLESRLYGGEPLLEAWREHLDAFERALGYRLDLRRDPVFRRAGRAIAVIASLEGRVRRPPARARRRLADAHATLRRFDARLAELVGRLVRTRVDAALLRAVVDEVRAEYMAGQVELDELRIEEPEEAVDVEVFRADLVLILKNVVRNAILAVGRTDPPRRIALDVVVDLEPTGEEIVRVRVRDTCRETPSFRAVSGRRVDRGLALVTAALNRYDGSIDVEPGGDGWAKAVTLRFFRALEGDETGRRAA